jgi:hypothetical protein
MNLLQAVSQLINPPQGQKYNPFQMAVQNSPQAIALKLMGNMGMSAPSSPQDALQRVKEYLVPNDPYQQGMNLMAIGGGISPQATLPQVAQAKAISRIINNPKMPAKLQMDKLEELSALARQVGVKETKKTADEVINAIIRARKVQADVTKNLRFGGIKNLLR